MVGAKQAVAASNHTDEYAGYATLFTTNGNRRGGTGEHVVCLRPRFEGDLVLPEATIEVWAWRSRPDGGRAWQAVGEPLAVRYEEAPAEEAGK